MNVNLYFETVEKKKERRKDENREREGGRDIA